MHDPAYIIIIIIIQFLKRSSAKEMVYLLVTNNEPFISLVPQKRAIPRHTVPRPEFKKRRSLLSRREFAIRTVVTMAER